MITTSAEENVMSTKLNNNSSLSNLSRNASNRINFVDVLLPMITSDCKCPGILIIGNVLYNYVCSLFLNTHIQPVIITILVNNNDQQSNRSN